MFSSSPNIAIYGFMGSGKSTLGKRLSAELKIEFIDLDQYIEKKVQKSIVDIFTENGEVVFRDWEHCCLKEVVLQKDRHVLSLGGGTLLRQDSQQLLQQRYKVFTLFVPRRVLASRIAASERPLREFSTLLYQEREGHYRSIGIPVFLDDESIDISFGKLIACLHAA